MSVVQFFKNLFAPLYNRLPVVRELGIVRRQLLDLATTQRRIEAAAITQAVTSVLAADPRYANELRLLRYGVQYCSQNLEDGMIAEILRRIGSTTRTFVEIGIGDGSENNTAALALLGWKGWWIEASPGDLPARLMQSSANADRIHLVAAFVTPENVSAVFRDAGIPSEVNVFSLDIDRDTYHIWNAMHSFRPRIVVVEYNAGIPPSAEWVCPYVPNACWDGSQYFGASLKSFELLGARLGYSLVGCDVTGINAFFVRNDLVGNSFFAPFTAENHYEPPRYGLTYRYGHPACVFDLQ